MANIWRTTEALTSYMKKRCAKKCEICGGSISLLSSARKFHPECKKKRDREA